MVLREPIPQPVEPLGDSLVGSTGERLRAGIDLDAGRIPCLERAWTSGVPSELF